ncbi:MAG TPA: ABC transporter ATP-binding protein [Candidatus Corynebacterium gallistercoris]|uniref:ABC transporter ATP-binding protein n=1 Tax=Candidatus Corynebacterium gallistercoris TaxID=2838530 RepID=A0A9D1URC7_9CORY|nr:ABC transporter ATP-binding protein [Candidatus Corynebacterium gallistercoris]
MSIGISATDLHVSYGDRTVIEGLDVRFPAGAITTIIGPNGCGKSTLLRAVSRLIPADAGTITVGGEDATRMKRKDLAKKVGVLPQTPIAPEGLIVADLVARGRHPHQSWIRQWSRTDEAEVLKALEFTNSLDLAERRIDALSGGQRQRVWISMVLAQNTEVLFLDEPTTYLDLAHSIDVLNLITHLKRTLERTVVMVLHDLNLAIRYSDNLVVMREGSILAQGTPAEIITPELLQEVFDLEALVVEDPATGSPLIIPAAPSFSS